VKLSVIDVNSRAETLYRRKGFEPVKSESLGALGRHLFGFSSATAMHRPLE